MSVPAGRREQREYSIYSSPGDDFLEVLVKEIPDGLVSPALRRCRPDDRVEVEGPHGAFTVVEGARDPAVPLLRHGHGSFALPLLRAHHAGLPYRLLHGVRTREDFRETREFMPGALRALRPPGPAGDGAFPGRLTDVLKKEPIDPSTYCYLCGNSDMIYEVYGILKDHGVPRDRIFAEVYF